MTTQEKIESIRKKITAINALRTRAGQKLYTLNPPISEEEIQAFENKNDIVLPEEYRGFLLQIGNGNQEVYQKGIYSLAESNKLNYTDEECLDLKTPFPFTGQIGLEIIWEDIYRFYPVGKVRNILDANGGQRVVGCILLNYEGWGSSHTALVVSGEQRGRVWQVYELYHPYYERKGNGFTTFSFLDWVSHLLDIELASSSIDLIKSGHYFEIKCLNLSGEAEEWQKEIDIEDVFKCTQLEFLDLSRNYSIKSLPESIGNLQNLVELKFNGGSLGKLPEEICQLHNLEILELSSQQLRTLPAKIGKLRQLKRLSLYWNNGLKKFPKSFSKLKNLVYLYLDECGNLDLSQVFPLIGQLPSIKNLQLKTTHIPDEVTCLKNLDYLKIEKVYGAEKVILNPKIQTLTQLKGLDLSNCGLVELPDWITKLTNLEYLILTENPLKTLPKKTGNLLKLTYISLNKTQIRKLPKSFTQLQNLAEIELDYTKKPDLKNVFLTLGKLPKIKRLHIPTIQKIPIEIGEMPFLEELILTSDYKKLQIIPMEIGKLKNLNFLRIVADGELILTQEFSRLKKLETIRIEAKSLELPDSLGEIENLQELNLRDCDLKYLPESFGQMKNLEKLYLEGSFKLNLADCLQKIASLPKLKKLRISAKKLPPEIGLCTQIKNLEIYNHPDYKNYQEPLILPDEIGNLVQLLSLDCSDNHMDEIPEGIGNLKKLTYLDLSDNHLSKIPVSIQSLVHLREFHLAKNQLVQLPSIGLLQKMVYLDISDNKMLKIPNELIKLLQLRELYVKNNPWGNDIGKDLESLPGLRKTDFWNEEM